VEQRMDCPNCGKQNSDDSPLCSSCGWVLCWKPPVQNHADDGNRTVSTIKRVVSVIGLLAGITTLFAGFLVCLFPLWLAVYPGAGGEFDIIGMLLCAVGVCVFCCCMPVAPIALVLAIVTLFIERNIWLRLLPLAFVLAGICLFAASCTF
jgi:hypothetical protein